MHVYVHMYSISLVYEAIINIYVHTYIVVYIFITTVHFLTVRLPLEK